MTDGAALIVDEPAAAKRVTPYAWYALGVLIVIYMINFIDRQIISILAEDIKADLDSPMPRSAFFTARRSRCSMRYSAFRSGGWPTAGIAAD